MEQKIPDYAEEWIYDCIPNLRERVTQITQPGEIEKILPHKTMYSRFRDAAVAMGESPALLYLGSSISFREMLSLVDTAAKGFHALGIQYNDVVTLSTLNTPYGIISLYALDKIGAVMHLVNSTTNETEIARELKTFRSKYLIIDHILLSGRSGAFYKSAGIENIVTISLADCMPKGISKGKVLFKIAEKMKGIKSKDGVNVLSFSQLLKLGKQSGVAIVPCQYVPDKNVTVAYTSGLTGNSKACVACWENIDSMVQVMAMTEEGRFCKGDVLFATFPLWIYYSLLNMIHEPLSLGVTLALDPLFKPENIFKRNQQYKFNHWLTIPPYIRRMVDMDEPTDCTRWKIIVTGGDALQDELKIAADAFITKNGGTTQLAQGYGASECLGCFSYGYYPDATVGSVGKPCVGNIIKILDQETGEELGNNQMGVGYFYTPARMKEYYGAPEVTTHNLVRDEKGVIWYNTEDLIHRNDKGEIFLDGRIRRIVLTIDKNGNPTKIIPDKVKKQILHSGEVELCEVITIPDDERNNVAIAFIVAPNKVYEQDLMEYCVNNLPEYMVPKKIIQIEEIPMTEAKKPDFELLQKMYMAE